MKPWVLLAGIVLTASSAAGCRRSGTEPVDTLIVGGTVWTGLEGPTAEALAIRGGKVAAVGTVTEVGRLTGPETTVIDATGQFVMPGLIDSHVHFLTGGFGLASVHLRDATTPEEFARRIGAFADGLAPGEWITGGEWDHQAWGGELPTREWIDSLTPENPVWVSRLDLHMALANSVALELAGVDASTPDVEGGEIVRGPGGRPTGILKDEAMDLVYAVQPEPTADELDRALAAAAAHAVAHGVTQVHDMQGWSDLETYRRAHARGELPIRVYSVVPLSTWERLRDYVASEGRGDDRLWWGGLKGFVDGSLGSGTAWFHEPYSDDPQTSGLTVTDTLQLQRWITEADAAGLQVIVHAIGDRANDWLLDTFAEAAQRNGPKDRRWRIEHAQHLSPGAIGRFAPLEVIASMQPYHAIDDGRWAEKRIGPDRIRTTYAFRSLLDAGADLAFGSDWTVAPLDPLLGVYAAVTRRTLDGANPGGWVPEQRITVEQALRAYTVTAAKAGFMEGKTGVLGIGAYADVVMLDANPLTMDPVGLESLHVVRTMVEGRTVYEREKPDDRG